MSEFQVVDPTLDEENAKEIRKEIKRLNIFGKYVMQISLLEYSKCLHLYHLATQNLRKTFECNKS